MNPLPSILASVFLACVMPLQAALTIVWNSGVEMDAYQSDGVSEVDGSFLAEIGIFSPGFDPDTTPIVDWNSYWQPFGSTPYNNTEKGFDHSVGILDNDTVPIGSQLYVWLRKQGPGVLEWFIATNDDSDGESALNWVMPDAASGDQTSRFLLHEISDATLPTLKVIFGKSSYQVGGGEGEEPSGSFDIQTHAIPEPTSAVALLVAGFFGLRRRRTGKLMTTTTTALAACLTLAAPLAAAPKQQPMRQKAKATAKPAKAKTKVVKSATSVVAAPVAPASITIISGTVAADNNNDDQPDSPLSGVTLTLWTDPNGDGNPADGAPADDPNTAGVDVYTTTTTNGSYTFTSVPPGNYVVKQQQPVGYLSVLDEDATADNPMSPPDPQNDPLDNCLAVTLIAGESDGGNNFLEELPATIAGRIFLDADNDDIADGLATEFITFTLFKDMNGDGDATDPGEGPADDPTTPELDEYYFGTTDGTYSFSGIAPGSYVVQQQQPFNYLSVRDGDDESDAEGSPVDALNASLMDDAIPATVMAGEVDDGNDFLEELPAVITGTVFTNEIPAEVIDDVIVRIYTDLNNDGDSADTGEGPVDNPYTQEIDEYAASTVKGQYFFSRLSPGCYVVRQLQPQQYTSLSDGDTTQDDGNSPVDFANSPNDNQIAVCVAGEEVDDGNDFIEAIGKPTEYAAWAASNYLNGQNAPQQNTDGDAFTNLEEFAYYFDPASGLYQCPLQLNIGEENDVSATLVTATGLTGITFSLETIADLAQSGPNGAGWDTVSPATVTTFGDNDFLSFPALTLTPALSEGRGFVRAVVSADLNDDGDTTDAGETARGEVQGWSQVWLAEKCQSVSFPFVPCPSIAGRVSHSSGNAVNLYETLGGFTFNQNEPEFSQQLYLEVLSGPFEGHRFAVDYAASAGSTLQLLPASPFSTMPVVPSLAGASVVLREFSTLASLFPPRHYTAGTSVAESDYVIVADGTGTTTYYLLQLEEVTHWVTAGSGTENRDNTPISPTQGLFVHRRQGSSVVMQTGIVRQTKVAAPLAAGCMLVANPYPVAASVVDRGLVNPSTASITPFTGANSLSRADQILRWNDDDVEGLPMYEIYYYLRTSLRDGYTRIGGSLVPVASNVAVFEPLRSQCYCMVLAHPDYVMPVPWVP